jgi:NADP-dependent 3-hydroxy acid dehydrogenase YdfG
MVEAAGYSGASDDYYKVNPTLDPENIAAGVLFMLSLPYKVQVKEKMYFPLV